MLIRPTQVTSVTEQQSEQSEFRHLLYEMNSFKGITTKEHSRNKKSRNNQRTPEKSFSATEKREGRILWRCWWGGGGVCVMPSHMC
ncbi:hypothetical protein SRHO_G00254120 [Serrasalmus rhombeus]